MSRKSEMRIVRQAIGRLIATGYPIDVNNGEAIVLYASRDIKVIMSVLGGAEEDYLLAARGDRHVWIRLVWGRGANVIGNYTTNLEDRGLCGTKAETSEPRCVRACAGRPRGVPPWAAWFRWLLLNVMMHNMMLHRSLRVCRVRILPPSLRVCCIRCSTRGTDLRHEGIGACRIRTVNPAISVAGHGRAAEAEKDCNRDYAELFHC
jgi:hypothetical protein